MNQPIFKHTSSTPPAVFQSTGIGYRPIIPQTYTPHDKNQEMMNCRPEIIHNKTANHLNFRPQQAKSTIFSNQNNQQDQNRTLKLQSFARKVSAQEQNNMSAELRNAPAARFNHSIQRALDNRQPPPPVFTPIPFQNKKPLFASQMLTYQHFRIDLNSKMQEPKPAKFPLQFPSKDEIRAPQMRGEMRLSLNGRENQTTRNQSKTDRQLLGKEKERNYINQIGGNIKYRQFHSNQQFSKNNMTILDSTQSSQTNSFSIKDDIKQNGSATQTNFIPKNNSPINFWPLSISPYENKKPFFPLNTTNVSQKNEGKQKIQQCTQFKKKKPLQFLNQSKKKNVEYATKTFTIDDFELFDKIGKGSFGDVYIAQQKLTGFLVVIKKLQKKKILQLKVQQHLLRQIKIQSFLKHRHLTQLYGAFCDQNYVYLILQIMPDGSLMQVKKKKKISQARTACYIRQICEGLKYMHTQQIIHRDIKPQNIFLNDGYAKIGDFGCSIYTQSLRNTIIGSLAYISPQQLKQGSYDQKIDVWSVGVMAYQMMVGKSPYEADIIKIAKNQIAPELSELNFPNQIELSLQAKNFLINMLHLDPNKRMNIVQALKHDFIRVNLAKQQNIMN